MNLPRSTRFSGNQRRPPPRTDCDATAVTDGEVETTTGRLLMGLATWNVPQNLVFPPWAYVIFNTAATGGVVTLARRMGLSREDLGLGAGAVRRGVRSGAPWALAALGGTIVALRHPVSRAWLHDERAAGAPPAEAALQMLVRIPLGTALFEETVFRGLLLGWFSKTMSPRGAVWASSALFGLWHVIPTWQTMGSYRGGAPRRLGVGSAAAVELGGVGASAIIGAGFCLLRLSARSTVAPTIVHAVANASGFGGAWVVGGASAR